MYMKDSSCAQAGGGQAERTLKQQQQQHKGRGARRPSQLSHGGRSLCPAPLEARLQGARVCGCKSCHIKLCCAVLSPPAVLPATVALQ